MLQADIFNWTLVMHMSQQHKLTNIKVFQTENNSFRCSIVSRMIGSSLKFHKLKDFMLNLNTTDHTVCWAFVRRFSASHHKSTTRSRSLIDIIIMQRTKLFIYVKYRKNERIIKINIKQHKHLAKSQKIKIKEGSRPDCQWDTRLCDERRRIDVVMKY